MPTKRKRPSIDSRHSEPEPTETPSRIKGTNKAPTKRKMKKRIEQPEREEEVESKLPRLIKAQYVPAPQFDEGGPQSAVVHLKRRSNTKRLSETVKTAERRVQNFLKYADKFRVDVTIQELVDGLSNTKVEDMERICEEHLGPNQPSRTFSAKYYSKDDEPLFFYLAERWKDGKPCEDTILDIKDQYKSSTPQDYDEGIRKGRESVSDGIGPDALKRYHQATQRLCSVIHPITHGSDKRHAFLSGDVNPRIIRYRAEYDDNDKEERRGVLHIVHGWTQQGQPSKGLFLSSEWTRSGTGLASIHCWFTATKVVSLFLQTMFKILFPTLYEEFQEAFDAGVFSVEDPGPWLGRAIIYKLQVDAHRDQRDMNPTASFPCGYFTGGEMQVPQLPTKFTYKPGHVCLFRSAELFHRVAKWEPTVHVRQNDLTPGRIGNVSFFPQESYNQLQGKEAGWGKDTDYGRWEPFHDKD